MMWFLLIICFVTEALGVLVTQCPEKTPVEDFDINGIGRGIWYEVARYPYPSREPIKFLVYESRMEGDLYIAETINVNRTSPYFTEVFSRMLPDPRNRGRITFEFSSSERGVLIDSPVMYILAVDYDKFFVAYTCVYDESQNQFRARGRLIESPVLYILGVDYDKYFVPYTCVHDADKKEIQEYGWILSRTKPVIGKSKEEFIEICKRTGLDEDKLIWYDQEGSKDV